MSVMIKSVLMGKGRTKICVPIIGKSKDSIIREAKELKGSVADIIEWRADFFEDVSQIDKVLEVANELTDVLGDKPVLYTFRTKNEGGERDISVEAYNEILKAVINQSKVAAVDVELFIGDGILEQVSKIAKEKDVKVIASNHDFNKTPDKDEIVKRLIEMKDKGADISKIALMPTCPKDVLTLLEATEEVKSKRPDITLITMSMGQLGAISRLCGKTFGSSMTFGAKNKELASAPGQFEISELEKILDSLEG